MTDGDGRKHALAGGAKAGGYWAAQTLPDGNGEGLTLQIGEGVATTLSARQATEYHSVAALSCNNLRPVAQYMHKRYPRAKLVVLADLGNGQKYAEEAARSVGGLLALPMFDDDGPEGASDFNDMATLYGLEAVAGAIANAKAPTEKPTNDQGAARCENGAAANAKSPTIRIDAADENLPRVTKL